MPAKEYILPDIGLVKLYKRRGARSIRLTLHPEGYVRVSLPMWTPYKAGLQFVKTKEAWIIEHKPAPQLLLKDGDRVGKGHRLAFRQDSALTKPKTRVLTNDVVISYPATLVPSDAAVQHAASSACIRALRLQGEKLLPMRLQDIASQHGFSYNEVRIKQLKARWGSCDTHQNIALNLFLMQLPWELIDYVLLHELVHTRIMAHGPRFWAEMGQYMPRYKALRKEIKTYPPRLIQIPSASL